MGIVECLRLIKQLVIQLIYLETQCNLFSDTKVNLYFLLGL